MLNNRLSFTRPNCDTKERLLTEMQTLLKQIGPGYMMNTAYDTAWVARLHKLNEPIAEQALDWLRKHQLADGSWGAAEPLYHHDRVICTLAAVIALAERGLEQDQLRVSRGLTALKEHKAKLHLDLSGETIAFEMLMPALMAEAKALNLVPRGDTGLLNEMAQVREIKLAKSPGKMISRLTTLAFSAEVAGPDGMHILDLENLQEPDGSVGYSPSATAYYTLNFAPGNKAALNYLRANCHNGGVPNVAPFDVFEPAWTLWNIGLTHPHDQETLEACQPHLDFLERHWRQGQGIGFAAGFVAKDSDETSVVLEVLSQFGRPNDIGALLSFEEEAYFRCFDLEVNPSVSANIHVLSALRQKGYDVSNPSVNKILRFLDRQRTKRGYWLDKWQFSPYYTTAHLIIACAGYFNSFVHEAVNWIISTQHQDGSWGHYCPTAEETAYCLQALAIWKREGQHVPEKALDDGTRWLEQHKEPPYPPLWIGKCLYSPILVIKSAILSALALVGSEFSNNNSQSRS
ncbi:cyclase [Candidatus Leptofilum sp.]|uniref:cyclase n=1 Tax=Candidatus Leptofilum sp. TaxID=3241576 RepID=UPI003B59D389